MINTNHSQAVKGFSLTKMNFENQIFLSGKEMDFRLQEV